MALPGLQREMADWFNRHESMALPQMRSRLGRSQKSCSLTRERLMASLDPAGAIVGTGPLMAAAADSNYQVAMPIAAGITGAFLSASRSRPRQGPPQTYFEWATAVAAGVAVALFVGPVISIHLNAESAEIRAFINLLTGLLGVTLVDLLLSRAKAYALWLINKGEAVLGIPPGSATGEVPGEEEKK
jgi:hypothetical protein